MSDSIDIDAIIAKGGTVSQGDAEAIAALPAARAAGLLTSDLLGIPVLLLQQLRLADPPTRASRCRRRLGPSP